MSMKQVLVTAGAALALAAPARAQQMAGMGGMPESYRQVQMSALELQRHMQLAMVDSMPERLYRDRVTPIQRDFAQQIGHAAGSVPFIITRFLGAAAPQLPDTAVAFNSRAGLRSFVNAAYDWAENVLRNQTTDDRNSMVNFFGKQMPKWQVWDELHQHSIWTAGQVVANFRKNGMAPPGFGFF